jgi:hypothetical protein
LAVEASWVLTAYKHTASGDGHIRFGPRTFDRGDHEIEVLGFEDCCDSHFEIEVHLPCDGPIDDNAVWRILKAGEDRCMQCGEESLKDLECLSGETALSTELITPKTDMFRDTRHAICSKDGEWHGSFPKCVECDTEDFDKGLCGLVCAFGIDELPPIQNAGWGSCPAGGTLDVGRQCDFQCDEGFVSYASTHHPGRPRAECKLEGRTVQLSYHGMCVDPSCVDHGGWATDFPAATGTITTPVPCETTDLDACQQTRSKQLVEQALEVDAQARTMFGEPALSLADNINTHILLYPIEGTAQLHTMFDDGTLQITKMIPQAPWEVTMEAVGCKELGTLAAKSAGLWHCTHRWISPKQLCHSTVSLIVIP